ncbi:MAG: hypothetical protein JRH20_07315 [Deltaproteobacteria bacterium]|nr:hypothetical protein [Deltaproteobacteria bacterium]
MQKIRLGKTRRGHHLLVRQPSGDFSLMVQSRKTGKLRPSRSKRAVTNGKLATLIATIEAVRLHESGNGQYGYPNSYGERKGKGILKLGWVNYQTTYHGLTKNGSAHIVEFNPTQVNKSSEKARHADSRFMLIDVLKGGASTQLTVPNNNPNKGTVIAHWINYQLK